MALNLKYRIKRILQGESGIVEKVEPAPKGDYYIKDYYKNQPMEITFRNPIGELVKELSPLTYKALPDNIGWSSASVYKTYKPGDKFP